jgi:Raf kinase inhibitor-like YbhB/YbcL family protein
MKRRSLAGTALAACVAGYAGAADFSVASAELTPGAAIAARQVYNGYGCSGGNLSPSLRWSGAPKDTRSYAVTVFDPDAGGSGWWHWVVVNIPANVGKLDAGAGSADGGKLPPGALQTTTDFGTPGYGGPCPPPGDKPHRYIFTVYALKTAKLDLGREASGAMTESTIKANMLAKATFTATYRR